MKTVILTIISILGLAAVTLASDPETLAINIGQHKTSVRGKINVKVVAVVEDSRCPVNVNCVWAGNAKIKITLAKGKKAAKTFDLNSTLDPQFIVFEGYDIRFVDLTPRPGETGAPGKCATISITKHKK